jgi:5-methylcytosine-specific restriction endonuclease McrA
LLVAELQGRWDLLEVAFSTGLPQGTLDADEKAFFRREGPRRTVITGTRPVLNGYQNGLCFYCGEPLVDGVEVDHVLPWSALHHDQIWNLVLAYPDCNGEKRALLPSRESLANLLRRNEYYIASNHPIKPRLVGQMGRTVEARMAFLNRQYREAELMKLHVWRGRVGITPDPLSSFNLVGDIRVS